MNVARAQRRAAAIDRRAEARQHAAWILRARMAATPAARRLRDLTRLRELAARVERCDFTAAERLQAEALLTAHVRVPRQRVLDLGVSRG